MIHVTRKTNGTYTVKLDAPEQILLRKIGEAYSLSLREAMESVVLRGMESIGKLIVAAGQYDGSTDDHSQDDLGG